jgi:hypothetical protein
MYKSEMCYIQTNNESTDFNPTLYKNATISSTKDSDKCIDYPTVKVLLFGIFIFEFLKVISEFRRTIKRFKRKYKQIVLVDTLNLTNSGDTNRVKSDNEPSEIHTPVKPIRTMSEKNKNFEKTYNLPSSSSLKTNAPSNISSESEHHRFAIF